MKVVADHRADQQHRAEPGQPGHQDEDDPEETETGDHRRHHDVGDQRSGRSRADPLAVLEEAQTFLGDRVLDDRNIFVRWVKEGRKYGLGCVLVILQPFIAKKLAYRRARLGTEAGQTRGSILLWLAVALTGVYGGYFGAAQGVLLIAILGIGLVGSLPYINAIKNVLATIVNSIAAVVFVIVSEVNWPAAIAIAVGSVLGAQVGGKVGRKIPPTIYRVIIVAVGIAAIVSLLS